MNEVSTDLYLVLSLDKANKWSAKLKARLAVRQPKLAAGEVALNLTVSVPKSLFDRPALSATITVPATDVPKANIDAQVMDNIAETLSQQLGLRVIVSATPETPE